MRCPECAERNSVAAKTCVECGHKFKGKQLPLPVWIGLGVAAVGLTCWGVASAVVPKLSDPSQVLNKVGKQVASGPRSPEDAARETQAMNDAVTKYLLKNGKLSAADLAKNIQTTLANGAFEVHGFELPAGMKVIELDTILQTSDFLVFNSASTGTKVFPLPNVEVFDSAQLITDQAAPYLVIVSHSGGQVAHRPIVAVYDVLPDGVKDASASAVPAIVGDGVANFAANKNDIVATVSLYSIGAAEHLFNVQQNVVRNQDENVRVLLTWHGGKYTASTLPGKTGLAALYAVSKCLQNPTAIPKYSQFLGRKAKRSLMDLAGHSEAPNFTLAKLGAKEKRHNKATFGCVLVSDDGKGYTVDLQQDGQGADEHVIATAISKADEETIASVKVQKAAPQQASTYSTPAKPASIATEQNQVAFTAPAPTTKPVVEQTPKEHQTTDPTVNPHHAKIVEKVAEQKSASKSDTPLEDRILSSGKEPVPSKDAPSTLKDTSIVSPSSKIKVVESKTEPQKIAALVPPPKKVQVSVPKKVEVEPAKEAKSAPSETDLKSANSAWVEGHLKKPDEVIANAAGHLKASASSPVKLTRGPSDIYRTVGYVKNNSNIQIIGKKNGWYAVKVQGMIGYVNPSTVEYGASSEASHSATSVIPAASEKHEKVEKKVEKSEKTEKHTKHEETKHEQSKHSKHTTASQEKKVEPKATEEHPIATSSEHKNKDKHKGSSASSKSSKSLKRAADSATEMPQFVP